ncbi:hypothetical protein SADUNF_Sadunf16G0245100 [Salix dunnii]|uniref:Uncharacterized protein n=1 Tax=Salix dunnii TaxID=1413687 RepID=A0A835JG54_9ROSI|nr:hypothetical protein SADUNF_Sadunf16G0245100 [Salix dunnii]
MFSLKDMGSLYFFLAVEVIPTTAGLFLSQHKYIRELLATINMSGAKDISTPLSTTHALLLDDGTTVVDTSEFHRRAVAHSTTEVEYKALANAASETLWLSTLLKELALPVLAAPQLHCDNLGATHLSFNPVNHSRMKHILIDLHFVRDLAQKGRLQVKHVHTHDQLDDLFTKPLSRQCTEFLRTKIGLADGSLILWGHIREVCKNMQDPPSKESSKHSGQH